MDVTVSSRNLEVTDALRAAAVEKIGKLSRFLDGMDRAEVHFSEERNPRIADKEVCEVTLEGHGHHVRTKVAAADPFAAIDAATAKLEHQLHKLKTRLIGRSHPRRREPVESPPSPVDGIDGTNADADADDGLPRIVKTKQFSMKPMTPEEAVLQMELLGHGFYFFSNADTGRSAVIYQRADGDMGLIDEVG